VQLKIILSVKARMMQTKVAEVLNLNLHQTHSLKNLKLNPAQLHQYLIKSLLKIKKMKSKNRLLRMSLERSHLQMMKSLINRHSKTLLMCLLKRLQNKAQDRQKQSPMCLDKNQEPKLQK